jgi:hypothetical protein
MWSAKIEIETDDSELKQQILTTVDGWRGQAARMSVHTHEELPGEGTIRRILQTASSSLTVHIGPSSEAEDQDGEPQPPDHHF